MHLPKLCWKYGFRYRNGKFVMLQMSCPESSETRESRVREVIPSEPSWAVDIREVMAMGFVGVAALMLIYSREVDNAMILLVGLLSYAIGRTVPGKGK